MSGDPDKPRLQISYEDLDEEPAPGAARLPPAAIASPPPPLPPPIYEALPAADVHTAQGAGPALLLVIKGVGFMLLLACAVLFGAVGIPVTTTYGPEGTSTAYGWTTAMAYGAVGLAGFAVLTFAEVIERVIDRR